MAGRLETRLAKLEQRRAAGVPNVLEVRFGETDDEALARFIARHGSAAASCIVVPERCGEDDLEQQEQHWAELQRELIAQARAERRKEDHDHTEHRASERPAGRRNASAHAASDAAKRDGWQPRRIRR